MAAAAAAAASTLMLLLFKSWTLRGDFQKISEKASAKKDEETLYATCTPEKSVSEEAED